MVSYYKLIVSGEYNTTDLIPSSDQWFLYISVALVIHHWQGSVISHIGPLQRCMFL